MKKILITLLSLIITTTTANATSINRALNDSKINKSAIAISVRDINTGKVVYERNSKKPMIPASTLKAVTYTAALNTLGETYEFETNLYTNKNNELILELGADPYLKTDDIKKLLKTAKNKGIIEPKAFKINDAIIDNIEWGEGWQWDDALSPSMPKFSAYNLDKNLLKIDIIPTTHGAPAEIKLDGFYTTTFMNLVTTEKKENDIKIYKDPSIAADIITIKGNIKTMESIYIPIDFPKRYFLIRLEEQIRNTKTDYYKPITKVLNNEGSEIELIEKITNPISQATIDIMKNSNNMVAETVFKIAGGKYSNSTGSATNAIEMLKKYCKDLGVNIEDIKVVDGSGVSKNNLVTADFMTAFLSKQKITQNIMATTGEGTLQNRMLYFQDKIKAKTGTLSDVSAITGYITTLSGKTYAFDIMINDAKSTPSEKKMLEEYVLRAIHTSY